VEQKVQRELSILLKIKEHENILAFLEHFTSSLYGDIDPEDQSNKDISYIVTEMAGFSLFDFIELHKPDQDEDTSTRAKNIQDVPRIESLPPSIYGSAIQEDALRSIFTQLALALHSLHSQSIVHGDIKDENALISLDRATNTYRAKLCDFGHSKYLQPGSSACFSFYGTTILAPPEMDSNVAARQKSKEANSRRAAAGTAHSNQTPTWDLFYGYEADVWALGLTLYTMIHGDLPKELYETDKKRLAAYKRKRSSHRMFPFTIQDNIDSGTFFLSFVSRTCIQVVFSGSSLADINAHLLSYSNRPEGLVEAYACGRSFSALVDERGCQPPMDGQDFLLKKKNFSSFHFRFDTTSCYAFFLFSFPSSCSLLLTMQTHNRGAIDLLPPLPTLVIASFFICTFYYPLLICDVLSNSLFFILYSLFFCLFSHAFVSSMPFPFYPYFLLPLLPFPWHCLVHFTFLFSVSTYHSPSA
jgi:serine/threonine protein kinase